MHLKLENIKGLYKKSLLMQEFNALQWSMMTLHGDVAWDRVKCMTQG